MQTYRESDLEFVFPDDWWVRGFDQMAAYQSLSGRGLKGVDFIAISPDRKLWLIEVKNYRPRRRLDREYRATRKPPAKLAGDVAGKFTDSLRLIKIVNAYLHRSWWRRVQIWYRLNVRSNKASNYAFWATAHHLASRGLAPEFVLWMETPETNDDYDHRVYQELLALLPPGSNVIVAETEAPRGLPFRTRTLQET